MKKKHLTNMKKTLSVFLAVLMLMTAWVFVPGEHQFEAEAAATLNTYRTADKYGTPYWDGSDIYYSKWKSGSTYTTITWPQHIYMDVSESLQSAGYYYTVKWLYGTGTDYRTIINGFVFGGWGIASGYPTKYYTMTNMFNNYTLDASLPTPDNDGGTTQVYDSGNTSGDLYVGVAGLDWSGAKSIILRNPDKQNAERTSYVFMNGTPKDKGTGRYSTTGAKPSDFGGWQQWQNGWKNKDSFTKENDSGNWETDCYEGSWKEVAFDITIYDKSGLDTAVTKANNIHSGSSSYISYATNASAWNTFTSQRASGTTLLKTRKTTDAALTTQTNNLNSAINNLSFKANNSALKTAVANAEAVINKPGYATLYTEASRNALASALQNAKTSTLYTDATTYTANSYADAGKRAYDEQNTINNLANGVNTALNGLKRKYDVGYDNLFSFTDWAASTSSTAVGGTVTIDADSGTITITDDASVTGNDTYTNHGADGMYAVKVKANTEYVFEYVGEGQDGTVRPIIFDTNAAHNGFDSVIKDFSGNGGKQTIRFTSPGNDVDADGYTYIHFRFGVNGVDGGTATYRNIALYEGTVYDSYAKNYTTIREVFSVGETKNLSYAPNRDGWVFDGWVDGEYKAVTSVAGLSASDTVYATWTKLHTVTFLKADGTVLVERKVKDGKDATPPSDPTKASDNDNKYTFAAWDKDFTNVKEDITVTPLFTATPHGNFTYSFESPAKCEQNAIVIKKCVDCNYSFGKVEYDGTENTDWIAKGHDFTGEIVKNSYIGDADKQTDADTHERKCSKCDATTVETHENSWLSIKTEGATCSVPGTVYWECGCGATKTTTGDKAPTVHVNTKPINAKDATCTEDGKEADTYCEDCKQTIATGKTIPANDHSFTVYTSNNDATCTVDGTKKSKCNNCDEIDIKTDTGSAKGHIWEDKGNVLVSAADCENDAVYQQTCAACGISADEDTTGTGSTWSAAGTKKGHNYTDKVNNLDNGNHNYLCKNGCGTFGYNGVKNDFIPCTYGAWSTTEDDTHTKTCTECKHSVTENHQWSTWTSTDPDKEDEGEQTHKCEACGKEVTVGCKYKETHNEATCTTREFTSYECEECGHGYAVYGEDAKGHDYTDKDNVKSYNGNHNFLCKNGCGSYGYEGVEDDREACDYRYEKVADGQHKAICNDCGYNFTQGCSVGENGKEATCSALAVCGQCGEEFGDTAPHNFTAKGGVVVLENDKHAYRCEYCKDENKYGIGANENHTEECSGGKATCSAPAECTVCNDGHGDVNPSAHDWNAWENITGTEKHQRVCKHNEEHKQEGDCFGTSPSVASPDCNTPGFTLNTCEDCGHTWKTEPVDALGHDWSNRWVEDGEGNHTKTCARNCSYSDNTLTEACADAEPVVNAPTCTEGGYTAYTCDDCGYVWEADATPANGHSFTQKRQLKDAAYKRSDKTCTTDETYWYMCDNCNVSAETEKDKYTDITVLYWMPQGGEQTGHKFDEQCGEYLASPATCDQRATYFYSCSNKNCNEKGTETYKFGATLGHDWVKPAEADLDKYNVIIADCINDATYYYVCNREGCGVSSEGKKTDGETWTLEDSKTGHDFEGGYTAPVDPACDEVGVKEHWTCQVCYKKYTDKTDNSTEIFVTEIGKLGHQWESVAEKPATCEEDGYTKHDKCTREGCNVKSNAYQKLDAKGHEFLAENGYYCDEAYNYHAYKCTNCDAFGVNGVKYTVDASGLDPEIEGGIECDFTGDYVNYDDENGIHSHKLICACGNESSAVCNDTEPEKVSHTCTEAGYYKYVCEECGYEWTVVSDAEEDKALDHDIVSSSNGNGTHSKACSRCDYEEAAEACTTATPVAKCGEKEICDICKEAYGESVAHTFINYVHDENSEKCQIDGTKTAKCEYCDATDTITDKGSALEHVMTKDWTYDLSGWDGMPEDFDEDSIFAPNCHSEGKAIMYCTNEECSYHKTKTVKADATLHQWKKDADGNEVWDYVSGDCGTGVTVENRCTVEGCDEVRTKTNTADHTWEIISYIAPTCVKNGYRELRCTVCYETEERIYDEAKHNELGEDYEEADLKMTGIHAYTFISETPATCASNAYITEKCTLCNGYLVTETEGTILDHNLVDYKGAAATCEAAGYTDYQKCSDCGTVVGKTEIPATGHGKIGDDGKCEDCNGLIYDSESGASCGCICHKESGLMKLIYKILNFFWKLFKISKACECGNVHW